MTIRYLAYTSCIHTRLLAAALILAALLSACSGGGRESTTTAPPAAATVASGVLKLGTIGETTDLIAGIDLQINLPAGVTVDADPISGETTPGVVALTGVAAEKNNSLAAAKYAPADGNAPAVLHLVVINAAGFHPGEFAAVRFNLAAGAALPALHAFTISSFTANGPDSAALSGIIAAPLSIDEIKTATARMAVTVVGDPPTALTMTVSTPTNTGGQTITGTVISGQVPTITASAPALVTALSVTAGNWSAHISGLVEGVNTITAMAVSGTGTIVTATAAIILDTAPPFLNLDAVLGTRNDGKALSGSAGIESRITVTCDKATADVVFFDDALADLTRWSAMVLGLEEGQNRCTVTATDAAGNATSKSVEIPRDNNPPDLIIQVNALIRQCVVSAIMGTVESGITPALKLDGEDLSGSLLLDGSSWSYQVDGLDPGDHVIAVTAIDQYGNVTTRIATITVVPCDGNLDGLVGVTVADALKALRIAVGLDVPTTMELLRGDLYIDGVIDVADAILILKRAVGLFEDTTLPNYGH